MARFFHRFVSGSRIAKHDKKRETICEKKETSVPVRRNAHDLHAANFFRLKLFLALLRKCRRSFLLPTKFNILIFNVSNARNARSNMCFHAIANLIRNTSALLPIIISVL